MNVILAVHAFACAPYSLQAVLGLFLIAQKPNPKSKLCLTTSIEYWTHTLINFLLLILTT